MHPLNIHYLQHVPFEGLGSIERWVNKHRHQLTSTKFFKNVQFPPIQNIDWLIVMGGPMGAYDEPLYPWLTEEKKFIEKAIREDKTVIGICLGAQLVADVLGAKVYPNKEKEIGWFDVELTAAGKSLPLFSSLPASFPVFHWHGDTFDLPEGAQHLARSEACRHQAFLYQENVVGLQFHFEVTRESIAYMLRGSEEELVKSNYIQTAREILNIPDAYIDENTERLNLILNKLHERHATPSKIRD